MRYMFLISLDEAKFAPMTRAERDAFGNGMLDYNAELQESGHKITSEPLKQPAGAITVRHWQGALTTTVGSIQVQLLGLLQRAVP